MNATAMTTTRTAAAARRVARTEGETPEVPELTITRELFASGAVFNIKPERIAQMKNKAVEQGANPDELPNFPVMSGSIQDEAGSSIPVSVFIEAAQETGEVYASLSLGGKGKTKHYGKLFQAKEGENGGPQYSGFIIVLPVTEADQYTEEEWADAPRLQVTGWRRRSANGQPRINLNVAPRVVADNELPL
jgi:hypothetical protein